MNKIKEYELKEVKEIPVHCIMYYLANIERDLLVLAHGCRQLAKPRKIPMCFLVFIVFNLFENM